jgi:N-acetylglutamate synthase-like GNAT family acetyltransferase
MVPIRPATPDDVDAVTELVVGAYAHYVPRIGREPAPMTVDYREVVAHEGLWVAADASDIVGVIAFEAAADHLLIGNVAVAPNRQREGIGSELLAFAEQRAADLGLKEIRLYTNVPG